MRSGNIFHDDNSHLSSSMCEHADSDTDTDTATHQSFDNVNLGHPIRDVHEK